MASVSSIVLALVFATLVANSEQLQCFKCGEGIYSDTAEYPSCRSNNFDDSLLITCDESAEVCTTTYTITSMFTGTTHNCGTTAEKCRQLNNSSNGITIACGSCDTDKCNGK